MSRFSSIGGAVLALAVFASTSYGADSVTIVPTLGGVTTGAGAVSPPTDLVGNTLYVYSSGAAATYTVNYGVTASFGAGEEFGNVLFGVKPSSGLTLGSTYTPNNSSGAWLNVNTGSYNTLNGSFGNTPTSLNQIVASVGAGSSFGVPYAPSSVQAQVGLGGSPTPVGSVSVSWDGVTAGQVLKVQDANGVVGQLQFSAESTTNGQIGTSQTGVSSKTMQFVQALPGDANFDGNVNGLDLVTLAHNFNVTETGGPSVGDFNNDGTVNGLDLVVLAHNFGASWTTSLPSPLVELADLPAFTSSAAPEPASLGVLALGGMALIARRRKA